MTVRRSSAGTILLEGDCPVEDAETLLQLVQANSGAAIDWTSCQYLHTAVLQVVLAAARSVVGPCGDDFVGRWIEPGLGGSSGSGSRGSRTVGLTGRSSNPAIT
jgi:hypothetical protein